MLCQLWILLVFQFGDCVGLRFTYLGVPGSISRGDSVWLDCGYDLEGDELYSVKWYKDNVEFYRFLPSDSPSAQMYNLDGVFLDLQQSNATHAFLYVSDMNTEGIYGCEVSTEVPSFRTIKAEKELRVHDIPDQDPEIIDYSRSYGLGDAINMTCVFGPSKPPAELKWLINNEEALESYVQYSPRKFIRTSDLQMSESRLVLLLEADRFVYGSLKIQCVAVLSQVHAISSLELVVGEGSTREQFQRILHVPPGQEAPVITGAKQKYFIGDIVELNCTSARSREMPQLQWYITDKEAEPDFQTSYPTTYYPDGLFSMKLGLTFSVSEEHVKGEEIKLKCKATSLKTIQKSSRIIAILQNGRKHSSFHTTNAAISRMLRFSNSMMFCLQWIVIVFCCQFKNER